MFVWQANVEFIGSAVAKLTVAELLQLKVSVKDDLFRLAKVDSFCISGFLDLQLDKLSSTV